MKEFNFSLIENGPIKLDIVPKEETFNDILFDSDGSSIELKSQLFCADVEKLINNPIVMEPIKKWALVQKKRSLKT